MKTPVPVGNLRPNILMVKSAQDRHGQRLTDGQDEATRFKKRNISATIVANVRRFCYRINTDEVFGTHSTGLCPLLTQSGH